MSDKISCSYPPNPMMARIGSSCITRIFSIDTIIEAMLCTAARCSPTASLGAEIASMSLSIFL